MAGYRQQPAERELVKAAMAILRRDWWASKGSFPTAAELAKRILGTEDGATNIIRYLRHGEFPSRGEKAIAGLNPASGRLLQGWIAALSPRKSLVELRAALSEASAAQGLSKAQIAAWTATDVPIWPGVLHDLKQRDPLSLFVVDLIVLRRHHNHGTIYQTLTQAWFTALSLAKSVAARVELRAAAPVVWLHVMQYFVPSLTQVLGSGTFYDYHAQWLPPEQAPTDDERTFQYNALRDSISFIVDRIELPPWLPDMRARLEATATLAELRVSIDCDVPLEQNPIESLD